MEQADITNTRVAHALDSTPRTADVHNDENITFTDLLLSKPVLHGLRQAGFHQPSPIQIKSIPFGRCGFDLVVQAKSGTGKTCVFAVIALENVDVSCSSTQVLVLAPTREIAVQIQQVICSIGCAIEQLHCQMFIGGLPLADDVAKLKKCHIAVGTPGRVKQLITEQVLSVQSIRIFILDEADKLLESGFQEDINWIYSTLPANKQMMTLSATYPESLARHITSYMRSPVFIRLNASDPSLLGVRQYYKQLPFQPLAQNIFERKCVALIELLSSVDFHQCLVFSNYHLRAASLNSRLDACGWPSAFINGMQDQTDRLSAVSKLRKFQCRVFISTDLMARGIDVENVNLVVNLDVPHDHETYLHRVGRTGRYGTYGTAVTFVCGEKEKGVLDRFAEICNMAVSPLPEPLHVDLLRGISDDVHSGSETTVLSNGVACGSRLQEADNVASEMTATVHDQHTSVIACAEIPVDLVPANTVDEARVADSVRLGSTGNDVDQTRTEAVRDQMAVVENGKQPPAEDVNNQPYEYTGLQSDLEFATDNDLLDEAGEQVDISRLLTLVQPPTSFLSRDIMNCSFEALAADHENFCKENAVNVPIGRTLHSVCGDSNIALDKDEAVWSTLSRWLMLGNQQFSRQFPACSALIRGSPESDRKCTEGSTINQLPNATTVIDEVVSTVNHVTESTNNAVRVVCDVTSDCNTQFSSPKLLSRDQILGLRYKAVPLSQKVIERVRELKLKATDCTFWPHNGKQKMANLSASTRPKANSSSIVTPTTVSSVAKASVSSSFMEKACVQQLLNQCDVTPEAVSGFRNTTLGSSGLPQPSENCVQPHMVGSSTFLSDTSCDGFVDTMNNSVTSHSSTAASHAASHAHLASDVSCISAASSTTLVDSSDVRSSSDAEMPVGKHWMTVPTTHHGYLTSHTTGVMPVGSHSVLSVMPEPTECHTAVEQRRSAKHCSKHDTVSCRTSKNPGCDNPVSKPVQWSTPWPEQKVITGNVPEGTKEVLRGEKHHQSSQDFVHSSTLDENSRHSTLRSQHPKTSKCSHCRNAKRDAACDPGMRNNGQSHRFRTSSHDRPYKAYDYNSWYRSYYMHSVAPSVASASYWLGAYSAHVSSMQYYNMLNCKTHTDMWRQQADYISGLAKLYAHR